MAPLPAVSNRHLQPRIPFGPIVILLLVEVNQPLVSFFVPIYKESESKFHDPIDPLFSLNWIYPLENLAVPFVLMYHALLLNPLVPIVRLLSSFVFWSALFFFVPRY